MGLSQWPCVSPVHAALGVGQPSNWNPVLGGNGQRSPGCRGRALGEMRACGGGLWATPCVGVMGAMEGSSGMVA